MSQFPSGQIKNNSRRMSFKAQLFLVLVILIVTQFDPISAKRRRRPKSDLMSDLDNRHPSREIKVNPRFDARKVTEDVKTDSHENGNEREGKCKFTSDDGIFRF